MAGDQVQSRVPPSVFNPNALVRKKRPLRAPPPEVHCFNSLDGVQLRLTRYQGGSEGPVMLTHGLGVSSLIFSIDTIETNLVEYLCAHGFDVWLLDYRASIELRSAPTQFTADDVATQDYPAAVAKLLELTGAGSVQLVAHCFGSSTFFMALLAGLQGVRSAVCSQVATHLAAPLITRIKCGLHFPEFLAALGIRSLTAYVDSHAGWKEQLYDQALKLYPLAAHERCKNSVCHRITFLYSLLYEHEQLNAATHDALHEMFGVANVRVFEHLALMVRKGHVVSAEGGDAYLPHLQRLAIPITFIHGAENQCFLPHSTEITYNLLREKNSRNLYTRHVIAGYGHIDCIFGQNAVKDVYPVILGHLQATAAPARDRSAVSEQVLPAPALTATPQLSEAETSAPGAGPEVGDRPKAEATSPGNAQEQLARESVGPRAATRSPAQRHPHWAGHIWGPLGWFIVLKRRYPDWYTGSPRSQVNPRPWPVAFRPQEDAVFTHNEIFIADVPPNRVFEILVRAPDWPKFYENSADVELEAAGTPTSGIRDSGFGIRQGELCSSATRNPKRDELSLGSKFSWKTFGTPQRSEVTLYEQDRALGWTAESFGTRAYHRWLLLPEGHGTRVITEECQHGFVAWLDQHWMNPSLHAAHQLWLESLKQVALN